jgi:rhodanese-related sulfurtransferase
MVDEAKLRIKTIGLDEAMERHGRDDVVFVDLRDVRELVREGMILGAFHCRRGMLEFWIDPESPYHKEVFASGKEFVFYCNLGAVRACRRRGAADVPAAVLDLGDGFDAWKEAGLPNAERAKQNT